MELAKLSGWDASEISYDNKVKTSILTLEDSNFIKRGLNVPRVFATSLLVLSMVEAVKIIDKSDVIAPDQKRNYQATRQVTDI